jgi:uncharacterized membrane protein
MNHGMAVSRLRLNDGGSAFHNHYSGLVMIGSLPIEVHERGIGERIAAASSGVKMTLAPESFLCFMLDTLCSNERYDGDL